MFLIALMPLDQKTKDLLHKTFALFALLRSKQVEIEQLSHCETEFIDDTLDVEYIEKYIKSAQLVKDGLDVVKYDIGLKRNFHFWRLLTHNKMAVRHMEVRHRRLDWPRRIFKFWRLFIQNQKRMAFFLEDGLGRIFKFWRWFIQNKKKHREQSQGDAWRIRISKSIFSSKQTMFSVPILKIFVDSQEYKLRSILQQYHTFIIQYNKKNEEDGAKLQYSVLRQLAAYNTHILLITLYNGSYYMKFKLIVIQLYALIGIYIPFGNDDFSKDIKALACLECAYFDIIQSNELNSKIRKCNRHVLPDFEGVSLHLPENKEEKSRFLCAMQIIDQREYEFSIRKSIMEMNYLLYKLKENKYNHEGIVYLTTQSKHNECFHTDFLDYYNDLQKSLTFSRTSYSLVVQRIRMERILIRHILSLLGEVSSNITLIQLALKLEEPELHNQLKVLLLLIDENKKAYVQDQTENDRQLKLSNFSIDTSNNEVIPILKMNRMNIRDPEDILIKYFEQEKKLQQTSSSYNIRKSLYCVKHVPICPRDQYYRELRDSKRNTGDVASIYNTGIIPNPYIIRLYR